MMMPQGRRVCPATRLCWIGPAWLRYVPFRQIKKAGVAIFPTACRVRRAFFANPKHDSRTEAKGVFHEVVKRGYPVTAHKMLFPNRRIHLFAIQALATTTPDIMALPVYGKPERSGGIFITLLFAPAGVCPATGSDPAKTMETRFFAPASLVSNLDFVESIFGNGGDPYLPENDAALT